MRARPHFSPLFAGAALVFGAAACAQITGVSKYDDCSGDSCDAAAQEQDSGQTDAVGPDSADSADARVCGAVDYGTDACGACLTTKCARYAVACGCDATCSSEAPCFVTAFTKKTGCTTCSKMSPEMTALLDCAATVCLPMCSCR